MPTVPTIPNPLANGAANMAQRLVGQVLERLESIDGGISRMLELQQSPRRNFLSAGTVEGGGTIGTAGSTCTVQPPLGAPPGVLLVANPRRRGLNVQNVGTAGNLKVGLGVQNPQPGTGIVLPPGASWDGRVSGELWGGLVSVVGSAAGVVFSYLEVMGPKSHGPNEAV